MEGRRSRFLRTRKSTTGDLLLARTATRRRQMSGSGEYREADNHRALEPVVLVAFFQHIAGCRSDRQ